MDVLLVVDMQQGMLSGAPKHDLAGVVERIGRLAARVRQRSGCIVFIQHDGPPGDDFAPHAPGWSLLDAIARDPSDRIVHKTLNDAFFGTTLASDLRKLGAGRVLIAGWATDLCVDATVRSAVALGFRVVVVADGHTLSDRPHASAQKVIEHHHWIWSHVIAPHPVALLREAEI